VFPQSGILCPATFSKMTYMRIHTLWITLGAFFVISGQAFAGLKICYIRHAEGGHNVKAKWEEKGVPKSEWPAYVGDSEMFTPKGEQEVLEATEKLKGYEFDFIATSPLWRARNTVLPYLRETKQKAEVWPELKEGTGMTMILSKDLPTVEKRILNRGDTIHIHKAERGFLERRHGASHYYRKAPSGSSEELRTAYMKHVTEHAISVILERFGESDDTILLVGHNSAGVSLLKLLLGREPGGTAVRGIDNIGMWMVEQQDDGSFKLLIYNDEPFEGS